VSFVAIALMTAEVLHCHVGGGSGSGSWDVICLLLLIEPYYTINFPHHQMSWMMFGIVHCLSHGHLGQLSFLVGR
jgi:hypothetical protein